MKGHYLMRLDGKHVVITGGRGGIGRPLVALMRQAGAQVTTTGRSPATSVPSGGYICADMAAPDGLDLLCRELALDVPDILVNLAGINDFCAYAEQDVTRIEQMVRVNLLAPMMLARAVLPGMLARKSGQIVNIGSVVGAIGLPHFAAYAATKSGLRGFSEALRREVEGTGVHVTHIAPRAVKTEMNAGKVSELNARTGTAEDDPEVVARRILQAIQAKEANVTIGFPEKFFAKVNALFPGLVDGGLAKNRRIGDELLKNGSDRLNHA